MKVFYDKFPQKPKTRCVATIGVFDGLHLGHQLILKRLKKEAPREQARSLVITFDIPPRLVLNKRFSGCISTWPDKKALIGACGIDYLWLLKARPAFLKLSGDRFLKFVFEHFNITKLIVGEDFRFGRGGRQGVKALVRLSKKFGFQFLVIKKKASRKEVISSSLIRELIKQGRILEVNKLLGRRYLLKGEVVKGAGKGAQLGFPTANVLTHNRAVPPRGVYAAYVGVAGREYLAAINIGRRPTLADSHDIIVEAHIINFRRNIIGKTIEVSFLEKLREEKKFPSRQKLKQAITSDIHHIKTHYRRP